MDKKAKSGVRNYFRLFDREWRKTSEDKLIILFNFISH